MRDSILGQLKAAFVIAFLIGGFSILSAPFLGQDVPTHVRVGIPIGIATVLMFIYGGLVWLRSRSPYGSDADADSLYYLGFIFTLISLTSQLVPQMFPHLLPNTPQLAGNELLGIFGLGLLTTFLGLAGRIALVSFQPEPVDAIDTSLSRLSETFDRVGTDVEFRISRTADGFENFGRSLQNVSEELQQSLRTAAARSQEEIRVTQDQARQLNVELAKQFRTLLEAVLQDLKTQVQSMSTALTNTAQGITNSGRDVEVALKSVAATSHHDLLEAIALACESIKLSAKEGSASLQQALSDVEATVQSSNAQFKDLATTTLVASKSLSNVVTQLAATGTRLEATANASTTAGAQSQKRIEELSVRIDDAQRSLLDSMDKLVMRGPEIDKQIESLIGKFVSVGESISSVIRVEPILLNAFDELQKKITQITSDTEQQLATIHGYRKALEDDLMESRSAVSKVHRELVGAVDQIKRELG